MQRHCINLGCQLNAAGFCPRCDTPTPQVQFPLSHPIGCVCPPGANLSCNNPICPRGGAKPLQVT